jgi:hypothetical protein
MTETKMIRIQYYRSKNSTPFKHRLVVKGWALRGSTRSSSAWIRNPPAAWSRPFRIWSGFWKLNRVKLNE